MLRVLVYLRVTNLELEVILEMVLKSLGQALVSSFLKAGVFVRNMYLEQTTYKFSF